MLWFRIISLALILSLSFAPASSHSHSQVSIEAVPVIDLEGGCLMGGSLEGKWLKTDEMARRMSGGDKYRAFNLNGEWKTITGGKPESQGAPCEDTLYVGLPKEFLESLPPNTRYVGLASKWNPMPRRAMLESNSSAVYRGVVATQLMKKGIRRPQVKIIKVVRVDLEGDGVDEVIINATRANRWEGGSITPNARAGDYSFVMLRKIINGKIQTIMLDQEYHTNSSTFSAPNEYNLSAVLDLNGDGVMEVVVDGAYYEGAWKIAYSIKGNKAVDVLSCGCGA